MLATLRRKEAAPRRSAPPSPPPTPAALRWTGESSSAPAPTSPCPPTPSSASATGWSPPGRGEPLGIGHSDPEHPLLGAAITLPAEAGWLFTARLSLQSHPWLADHALFGTAILPGTAFLELALQAAEQAGMAGIEELTLAAPLVLARAGRGAAAGLRRGSRRAGPPPDRDPLLPRRGLRGRVGPKRHRIAHPRTRPRSPRAWASGHRPAPSRSPSRTSTPKPLSWESTTAPPSRD